MHAPAIILRRQISRDKENATQNDFVPGTGIKYYLKPFKPIDSWETLQYYSDNLSANYYYNTNFYPRRIIGKNLAHLD